MSDFSDTVKVHLDNVTDLTSSLLLEHNKEGWHIIAIPNESKKKLTSSDESLLKALASLLAALRDDLHHASSK